mmetsp:Transcript_44575/g.140676  ORF Transcript_44575/g.140676 Transcript_44575/m.140676 type:complete len:205 (-) Transcript_44575:1283-1897(-)
MNSSHIPLRDSKMTRVLSKALSGRWLCATVTHVAMDSYEESEAVLLLTMKFCSITFSTRTKDDKRLEDVAGKKERIQHLCSKLEISWEGLKSSSICIEHVASEELLELRELLAEVEAIGKNHEEWEAVCSSSDRFKAGEGTMVARLDRKAKVQGREGGEGRKAAGRELSVRENVNVQVTEGHNMAEISTKLALLRERKALHAKK